MSGALDDHTVAYVLATRLHFDNLRDAAAQIAGVLVLAASGARDAAPDHPMLQSACALLRESGEVIRRTRGTARSRRHHQLLTQAAEALEAALSAARVLLGRPAGHLDLDPSLAPLSAGYAHLQHASRELPGFEIVGFAHACCGGGGVGSHFQVLPRAPLEEGQNLKMTPDTGVV